MHVVIYMFEFSGRASERLEARRTRAKREARRARTPLGAAPRSADSYSYNKHEPDTAPRAVKPIASTRAY